MSGSTIHSDVYTCFEMRDEKEERKKQARSNKQTRQSNTAHPRQSLFLEKMSFLGCDSNPRHSYTLDRALYQLSWLGPNLTSQSTPDEQANHQLSIYMYIKFCTYNIIITTTVEFAKFGKKHCTS